MKTSTMLAAGWVLLALVSRVYASEPTGLYAFVEEVELGPTESSPDWIKIRGVFMSEINVERSNRFEVEQPGGEHMMPAKGWLYFTLPEDKRELARAEWKELAKEAARPEIDKKVVAFGSSHASRFVCGNDLCFARYLVSPEKANAKQVPYPVGHGMYLIRDDSKPARRIKGVRNK